MFASSTLFALGHYGLYSSYGLSPLGLVAALAFIGVFAAVLGLEFLAYKSLIANITTHTLTNTLPVALAVVKHYGGWAPTFAAATALTLIFMVLSARYWVIISRLAEPLKGENLFKGFVLGAVLALLLVLLARSLNYVNTLLGLT